MNNKDISELHQVLQLQQHNEALIRQLSALKEENTRLAVSLACLTDERDRLKARVAELAAGVTQKYACGKPIPFGEGVTNGNKGCGEFNCGPCNKFIYGD